MGKLTPELRKVLKLQYPEDIAIEIRGEIVHFRPTEENWRKLSKGSGLKVFKEPDGDGNWVLYNPRNFKVVGSNYQYLSCISEENLEAPINWSSCHSMFSDFKFKDKNALKDFDTSGIKDMCYMFENCRFPDGFSLGNKFDTSNVVRMQGMFKRSKFPNGFSFGDKFDTNNVKVMAWMFSNCTLPDGFYLNDKFNTSNLVYSGEMFMSAELPERKTELDFDYDYNKVVAWLKSRNPRKSDKTSNTSFFNQ